MQSGGTPESPNSPVNHQEPSVCESGDPAPAAPHTHDSSEGEAIETQPPTEKQRNYIRSLCRQRDIPVPEVATASAAAELIDDLKAGKTPAQPASADTSTAAPSPPEGEDKTGFGRCGHCHAFHKKRNAMGFCEACADWLAEESRKRAEAQA